MIWGLLDRRVFRSSWSSDKPPPAGAMNVCFGLKQSFRKFNERQETRLAGSKPDIPLFAFYVRKADDGSAR